MRAFNGEHSTTSLRICLRFRQLDEESWLISVGNDKSACDVGEGFDFSFWLGQEASNAPNSREGESGDWERNDI